MLAEEDKLDSDEVQNLFDEPDKARKENEEVEGEEKVNAMSESVFLEEIMC